LIRLSFTRIFTLPARTGISLISKKIGRYPVNKKSPPSNMPSLITFTDSEPVNSSNPNDFNLVCVVLTDGSRNSPNGNDVLNNW
jgi:hypothetical protein